MHGTRGVLGSAVLAVVLAACGGGDQPPPANPSNPPASSSSSGSAPTPTAEVDGGAPATPTPTAADGAWPFSGGEDKAAQLDRLKKDPGPLKSNWQPPGKSERYGHAEGLVNASPDKVKSKLTDYTNYAQLAGPKFKTVKVIDKQGANTHVYFQLPIMKGIVMINYTTSYAPPKPTSQGDVIEGTFVKGNIKSMHVAFTIKPGADANSTVMVCDLLLQPNVPAPQAALDEELRDACGDAINNVRKQASAP
ncbi:MAG: hypothetical protein U0270_34400 [Labilithrix sp.]